MDVMRSFGAVKIPQAEMVINMSRTEYNSEHRMTIPFTRDQERDLKSLSGSGMTPSEVQIYFNEKYGASKSYECIRAYCAKNSISLDDKRIKRPKFTDGEIDFINGNSHLTIKEVTKNLNDEFGNNRSPYSVCRVIKRLGLKRKASGKHTYTQEQCEYLISYNGPLKDLSEYFNAKFDCKLTCRQIYQKHMRLLKKHTQKPTVTKETEQ